MKLSLVVPGVIACMSFAAAGCLVMPQPQAGGPSTATATPSDPNAGDPSSTGAPSGIANNATPSAPTAPKPMIPTSLEVHSDCTKTVGVFLGEKPGFSSGTRSSVSSNSTTTFPRKPDGSLTFWLLDDKDNGVTSTAVSASTKRVVIDRSCTSISST